MKYRNGYNPRATSPAYKLTQPPWKRTTEVRPDADTVALMRATSPMIERACPQGKARHAVVITGITLTDPAERIAHPHAVPRVFAGFDPGFLNAPAPLPKPPEGWSPREAEHKSALADALDQHLDSTLARARLETMRSWGKSDETERMNAPAPAGWVDGMNPHSGKREVVHPSGAKAMWWVQRRQWTAFPPGSGATDKSYPTLSEACRVAVAGVPLYIGERVRSARYVIDGEVIAIGGTGDRLVTVCSGYGGNATLPESWLERVP